MRHPLCVQDVLLSARSARSARAVAATSPATLQPEELSSASPAMNAFQQRLSPLLLRPLSARSNLSSATSTPMAAGSPEHVPSAATPGQQGGQWSPKPTVARLAGLQLRPGSSSSASEAASPASMAATPASLGRMLRQGGLAGEQLSRGLACYQEQQQQVAAAAREGAAASPAADGTDDGVGSTRAEFPRSDSSMLQAPENKRAAPQRPSSAPVRRKQLAQRPPTPSAAGGSSADFRIPAYKGSGTPRAHGPSPAGEPERKCDRPWMKCQPDSALVGHAALQHAVLSPMLACRQHPRFQAAGQQECYQQGKHPSGGQDP